MKVYPATKNTTSIIKFILQLEFSQIQELISAYSEMLLFFTKYSFFFESSITDYQPLKSEYVPIDSKLSAQDPARDGSNWYAYCNNSPLNFKDPTGLSTQVDEKTGTIIGATDDGDCGVYAYPTFDGQRAEGPAFPIGLTGTPGYFVSTPSNPGNIQISGQDKNYIGKNISDYGSGFAYGDFQFTIPQFSNIDISSIPDSTFNTWAHKKDGELLNTDEANVQKIIGGTEMGLGFAGIFFTGGTQVITGAYVMADGAIVFSEGNNNKKCTPFFHFANDFASPNIQIPNTKIQYVNPLP